MPASAPETAPLAPATAAPRGDHFAVVACRLFGLAGFVVAAPLLDVLGSNPTFFVAHNIDGWNLALFGVLVVVIPGIVPIVIAGIARLIARPALPAVTAVLIGALAALAIVPIIDRTSRLSTIAYVVGLVITAVAFGFGYHHWRTLRTYTTYLSAAPVLFLVVFLFFSSSSVLLSGTETVAAATLHGATTPIVMVVLDELPLGVLLNQNGTIDATRYPGFARLANLSTWYPHAVTVAPWTHLAVPAILTGQLPSSPVPVAATHPRSLFTLFGQSHALHVHEALTKICPANLCGSAQTDNVELENDTKVVYLHSLLPDALANDWLPPIGERWSGFSDTTSVAAPSKSKKVTYDQYNLSEFYQFNNMRTAQPGRFASFVESIKPSGSNRPGLWFLHDVLPHLPYQYTADGRPYNDGDGQPAQTPSTRWSNDTDLVSTAAQRLAVQMQLVDHLVSSLLDRLSQQGILKKALLVVTADHGITFESGRRPRGGPSLGDDDTALNLDARARDELLPVPMFIKYPNQSTGKVDDRAAQTIDVMPTIVDALNIQLPPTWKFDGTSLLGPALTKRPLHFTPDTQAQQHVVIRDPIDPTTMGAYFHTIVGTPADDGDLYRLAPYGALVGKPAAPLANSSDSATVTLTTPGLYNNVNLAGVLPAHFEASVKGLDSSDWVAIAVNGTIAGTGPVYDVNGSQHIEALLDPSFLHNGHNQLGVYLIGPGGTSLHGLNVNS